MVAYIDPESFPVIIKTLGALHLASALILSINLCARALGLSVPLL